MSDVLFGVYEAIKHSESLDEALVYDDIEVNVTGENHKLKRQKRVDVNRMKLSSHFREIFDEVMSRPRPPMTS